MEIANQIIFDNVVLYNRCTAKLVNILNPDNTATLTVPANECLAIIIKNAPEVTTQKQLFKDVWEVHGIPINTNTFYQNISILRKAFKQVSIDYDVIITIPRRGIEVAKNINMSAYSPPDSKEDNPPVCSLPRSIPAAKPGIQSISYSEKKTLPTKIKIILSFFILCFLLVFFIKYSYAYYIKITSPFYNYSLTEAYNGCHIYSNDSAYKEYTHKIVTKIISEQCSNKENIYLSTFPDLPRISVIICNDNVYENNSLCRSAYYYLASDKK